MIKRSSRLGALTLSHALVLSGLLLFCIPAQAQQQPPVIGQPRLLRVPFERGYSNGYNYGFITGGSEYGAGIRRDFRAGPQYQNANRGYRRQDGPLPHYQEGFRLGFEMGYVDGYYGRPRSARVPRHALALKNAAWVARATGGGAAWLPAGMEMRLRLNDWINTRTSREGERFTATVLEPLDYGGATVTGHIARIIRSNHPAGRTELLLAFDQIQLRDGRNVALRAQIEQIYESETVKAVDEQGDIETAKRPFGEAVLGTLIGVITGGVGAAIGSLTGAGIQAGAVYIQGQKDLVFEPGAEMSVRTSVPR
jgi:hypothetical protein